ncbi:MAG: hypothetical protein LC793_01220, partial [Thermomicrobia bacterium]|nr:hypothetical protein [Thermomicrobia bacterium]
MIWRTTGPARTSRRSTRTSSAQPIHRGDELPARRLLKGGNDEVVIRLVAPEDLAFIRSVQDRIETAGQLGPVTSDDDQEQQSMGDEYSSPRQSRAGINLGSGANAGRWPYRLTVYRIAQSRLRDELATGLGGGSAAWVALRETMAGCSLSTEESASLLK